MMEFIEAELVVRFRRPSDDVRLTAATTWTERPPDHVTVLRVIDESAMQLARRQPERQDDVTFGRKRLGPATLWWAVSVGPPRWTLPRVKVDAPRPKAVRFCVGWWYRAYTFEVTRP